MIRGEDVGCPPFRMQNLRTGNDRRFAVVKWWGSSCLDSLVRSRDELKASKQRAAPRDRTPWRLRSATSPSPAAIADARLRVNRPDRAESSLDHGKAAAHRSGSPRVSRSFEVDPTRPRASGSSFLFAAGRLRARIEFFWLCVFVASDKKAPSKALLCACLAGSRRAGASSAGSGARRRHSPPAGRFQGSAAAKPPFDCLPRQALRTGFVGPRLREAGRVRPSRG